MLLSEVMLDGETGVAVVEGGEWGVRWWFKLDVCTYIVGVAGFEGSQYVLKPTIGDGHIGVEEGEELGVCVSNTCVAGGVGGLDVSFLSEDDAIILVGPDDFGGSISGFVVYDEYFKVPGGEA